jgi:hypothetical protein
VNAIVPTLNIGPSFIGSRFGLNVVDVGAEVYVSDLLGQDTCILGGSIGKNFEEDVELNNSFEVSYQKKMVPVTSSTYTHSPTLFLNTSRWVIYNHINRFKGLVDSVYFADIPDLDRTNVLHDLHQSLDVADSYRHEFRYSAIGVQVPLAPRHYLTGSIGFRQYYETLRRDSKRKDFSSFIDDGVDITVDVPGAGKTSIFETRYFTDLEYFRSGEITIDYSYYRLIPTADSDIVPQGTAVLMRYKHLQTVIADSLIEQVSILVPIGMYSNGSFALAPYVPDPFLDELRSFKKTIGVNEYILFLQKNQELPYLRHVLGGNIFVGYRDIALKDV